MLDINRDLELHHPCTQTHTQEITAYCSDDLKQSRLSLGVVFEFEFLNIDNTSALHTFPTLYPRKSVSNMYNHKLRNKLYFKHGQLC